MISKKLIFSVACLCIAWLGLVTADEYQTEDEVESDDSILSSFLSHNNTFSTFFAPAAPAGAAGKYHDNGGQLGPIHYGTVLL